jgi:hypothetical protein
MKATIKKIVLLKFLLLSFVFAHAQTKVVEFDWGKKDFTENKSKFPFDEPFTFRVIGMKANQKIDVVITDITKNVKDDDTLILKVLDSSIDETGIFSEVVPKYLKPNHYFKVNVNVKETARLKSKTRDSLSEAMSVDEVFVSKIQQIFFASKYPGINIEDFNKLYEDYFYDNNLKNFKIDYKAADEILRDAKEPIGQALKDFSEAAERLSTLDNLVINILNEKKKKIDKSLAKDSSKKTELLQQKNEIEQALNYNSEFFASLYKVENELPYFNLNSGETLSGFLERTDTLKLNAEFEQQLKKIDPSLLKQVNDELSETRKNLKSFNSNTIASIPKVVNEAFLNNTFFTSVLGSNVYDNDTEAGIYTSQTFGYGYSPKTDNGLTYFSFSFFARPVNNSVPLSNVKGWDNLKVRLCANVGLTLEDITTNKNGQISGLGSVFGNKAGLVGLGIRPWAFLKVDANALLYYMKDPNPLITNKKFVASPFFGVSVNLNIVKLLSGQSNSLTTLQKEAKSNNH